MTYTIGEVAERSGFSTSALRYYEGIGLLSPTARSSSGYRLYDDDALARLAFITRAKQLGCSLDEITDLAAVWNGERCGPVQRRFHELVTDKLRSAQRQIGELVAFTAQLQAAAAQLAVEPVDGPCSDGCACMGPPSTAPATVPVALTAKPADPPIACTLDPTGVPDRIAEWQRVLLRARARTNTADGARRIEFDDALALDELTRLVAAEQGCCSFFSFAITVDGRGVALEVQAPPDASGIVASLFG